MTTIASTPEPGNAPQFSVAMGHGERLTLTRESAVTPLRYRLRLTRNGIPALDGELGRAEMMRLLMALQRIARLVDSRGLPGEGAP